MRSWWAVSLQSFQRTGSTVRPFSFAPWPAALAGLRIFILHWATFDADFLNSVWVAAIPGLVGTAVITYYVPTRLAELMWTRWLLVVPVICLVVLGYTLLP